MEFLTQYLEIISMVAADILGLIGIVIMVYGGLRAALSYIIGLRQNEGLISSIRIDLAQHFALGLDFLVGKDIIESIVQPTWHDMGLLAVIIAIRTFVTLFLSWEMKELKEEVGWWGKVAKAK